jgi:hypothetical protein
VAAIDAFQVIGDLGAGVAAVAALTGLFYARQTVREARAERVAAEQGRLARRLEWVGETIEHIDRLADDDLHMRPIGETWRRGCRLLAQGLIGLDALLPQTMRLVNCADPYQAREIVVRAREEIGAELANLARQQVQQADAAQGASHWEWPPWLTGLWRRWRRGAPHHDRPSGEPGGPEPHFGKQLAQHRARRGAGG